MKKDILIFEGVGWNDCDSSKETYLQNCRIRTRLKNNDGRIIFFELGGYKRNKYTSKNIPFEIIGTIDSCFYEDIDWDKKNCSSKELTKHYLNFMFEYNKENVLKFVNEKLNCSFDDIITINDGSVRVFDTEKSLSDCSKSNAKLFEDKPILYETIKDIKPLYEYKKHNFADYRIAWKHIKNYFENENEEYYIRLRWYKNEITSAELSSTNCNLPNYSLDKETARELISKLELEVAIC